MDSIHIRSTTLGAKLKRKGTSLKGLFHELRRIFISSHGDTLYAVSEEVQLPA